MRKCLAPEDTRIAMPHSIRIGDPVGLINNIARLYQSVTRILMEYVDNSLDDAEEVFRANGERYPEPVNIRVRINKKGKQVAVMDSCRGMKKRDLLRIVTDIAEQESAAMDARRVRFRGPFIPGLLPRHRHRHEAQRRRGVQYLDKSRDQVDF
jgi:hypothetical protein